MRRLGFIASAAALAYAPTLSFAGTEKGAPGLTARGSLPGPSTAPPPLPRKRIVVRPVGRLWDWAVTGQLKAVWSCHRRQTRGQVRAVTRSEARSEIKRQLGLDALPTGLLVY
jgi:hypothetical protein